MPQEVMSALFIAALNKTVTSKKELVCRIADILNLETGAVYRRLAGTVKFSADEIGVLAKEMNMSLDALLNQDSYKTPFFLQMGMNQSSRSMDNLVGVLEELALYRKSIKSQVIEAGAVIASLPLEFYMFHPYLYKYIYFKWGHHFIASSEFDNFSAWELPPTLVDAHDKLLTSYGKETKVLYFWDVSLMPSLINEINYHLLIGILTPEDARLIKNDLHELLTNFDEFVKGRETRPAPYNEFEFECYATNISVNISSSYMLCDHSYMSVISSPFLYSSIHYDRETALKIYKWIHSLRKISSLISGGCEKERVMFFRKQHQYLDKIRVYDN